MNGVGSRREEKEEEGKTRAGGGMIGGDGWEGEPTGATNFNWATGFTGSDTWGVAFDPSIGAVFAVNRPPGALCRAAPGGGASRSALRVSGHVCVCVWCVYVCLCLSVC